MFLNKKKGQKLNNNALKFVKVLTFLRDIFTVVSSKLSQNCLSLFYYKLSINSFI